ncbi:Hsp33 family molecular chaperone HslO [Mesomycoplasma molare]|uniref:Hsp33 family molecular chaperone HslO n=1 Tax=Mesomycoplasma molare TaxID=171288 RepID=A0ABY5TXP5_9BACT|nr:Hsp33 family molecular chaperone HslO [Mesomycoplasma molare]UWD34281.1 Hsp33 family molecular chaperone HslO [Mesomycoplasma molare]
MLKFKITMDKTKIFLKNNVRIIISDLTNTSQEAIKLQKTNPFPSFVLAKAISVLGPLASILSLKEGKVSSFIKSNNGTIKSLIVESNSKGEIRALIDNHLLETEKDEADFETIPLFLALGNEGLMRIVRTINGQQFGGEVKLVKSDIVTDLAYYFNVSEQIYTAIISSVKFKDKYNLERVYSAVFQLLPGHNSNDIEWIENFIKDYKLEEYSLNDYIKLLNAEFRGEQEYKWSCDFKKAKALESLKMLDKKEIEKILEEDKKIEVECHFCKELFVFKKEDF